LPFPGASPCNSYCQNFLLVSSNPSCGKFQLPICSVVSVLLVTIVRSVIAIFCHLFPFLNSPPSDALSNTPPPSLQHLRKSFFSLSLFSSPPRAVVDSSSPPQHVTNTLQVPYLFSFYFDLPFLFSSSLLQEHYHSANKYCASLFFFSGFRDLPLFPLSNLESSTHPLQFLISSFLYGP